MKNLTRIILSLALGFALCVFLVSIGWIPLNHQKNSVEQHTHSAQELSKPKILYWVAPMDPNFRRDEPGLSPMGMDLVPFYADDDSNLSKGTVILSPEVTNNMSVNIEHVQVRPWVNHIESFGSFEYDEERIHHLHSRVSGWIDELYVKAQGEKVIKGQPLYSFYSPELANAQEELMLSIRTEEKPLIHAAKAKLEALGVPENTIDDIIQTRKVKKNITYYAQLDGVVKKLAVRHGFYVKPESNIMSIAPLNSIWLIAEVFESQLSQIKPNDRANIQTDAYPNTPIIGVVDYIYPSLELPSRTAKIRIRVNNTNLNLKPNMFARVNFKQESHNNAVIVSLNSVIRTGKSNRVVLVKDDGSYQSVSVTLGRSDSQFIEILSGLEEGDCIASSAQFLIDSESSVGREFSRMNTKVEPENNHEVMIMNNKESLSSADSMTPSHHGH